MTGKKITARKARQVCNARQNARKVRNASQPYEIIATCTFTPTYTFQRRSLEEILRLNRRHEAISFLNRQKLRVNKNLIGRFCGTYSWAEADKSTGFNWVALCGLDFMTAVFKKDENVARRAGCEKPLYIGSFYDSFCSTVIAEMEDIADGTIRPVKKLPPGFPFAVVCETTSSTNVQECLHSQQLASNAAPNPAASVEFIRNEFRKGYSLKRSSKYIKTAISALQLVHKQTFKPDEIWVGLWDLRDGRGSLSRDSIEEYLADINCPDSGGCSKEDHSHDINGGFSEDHLVVNEPDSGGCTKEEHSQYM